MDIGSFLQRDDVLITVHATNKRQLLQELARVFAEKSGLPQQEIFQALSQRERLGSTGMGKGLAIPHARLPALTKAVSVFVRLPTPIAFDSLDDTPVDLVFGLIAPVAGHEAHLDALARISRQLRGDEVRERLRSAGTSESIYSLLTANDDIPLIQRNSSREQA